nr:hypothetical protein CFP56_59638 [Quercus suber]
MSEAQRAGVAVIYYDLTHRSLDASIMLLQWCILASLDTVPPMLAIHKTTRICTSKQREQWCPFRLPLLPAIADAHSPWSLPVARRRFHRRHRCHRRRVASEKRKKQHTIIVRSAETPCHADAVGITPEPPFYMH